MGKSGEGKTFIINLLRNKLIPIADDILIIKPNGEKFFIYSSPFIEKNQKILQKTVEKFYLDKIFIIKKSNSNLKIKRIENKMKAIKYLSNQMWCDFEFKKQFFKNIIFFIKKKAYFY